MKRNVFLLVVIIVFLTIYGGNLWSEDRKVIKDPFNVNEALLLLYGGNTWTNSNLSGYFEGRSTGYISLAFESSYTENNQEKHVVISHITPEPVDDFKCHACSPAIGGAVFVKVNDGWMLESEKKIIGWSSWSYGEEMRLVKIGSEKYGVMLSIMDVAQGYETKFIKLIVPYNGELNMALSVGFIEKPGSGACGKRAHEQKVELNFDRTSDSDYFDVVAYITRNEGSCQKLSVHHEADHYRFVRGKYKHFTVDKRK